jgi:hypothetical protein
LIPPHHWAENFTVSDEDIEYLLGLLLENETPLTAPQLAQALIEHRLQTEANALSDRYKDVLIYNPSHAYAVGQRVLFPAFDFAVATVAGIREGSDGAQSFKVVQVAFEDAPDVQREFAAEYPLPHRLSETNGDAAQALPGAEPLTAEDILEQAGDRITAALEERLQQEPDLVSLAGSWFPSSLMLDVNLGHLNLAEAILDLSETGPMTTEDIITAIGGIADAPMPLQVFSLNHALNQDARFDEVGPVNTVLWTLKRLEPEDVLETPAVLRYSDIPYDSSLLTSEMQALEAEIDDEWSDIPEPDQLPASVRITLIYPHRRVGTLPLTAAMRRIFPTARKTPRIYVTLVDGQDGEEYPGWVVRAGRYVSGLNKLYRKHRLPIGATVSARPHQEPGKIVIDFNAHNPRKEYVRLIVPRDGQISFDDQKRAIGAAYDDLMILGADDLAAVDALHSSQPTGIRKPLHNVIKMIVAELSRQSSQGTVHAKTIYSAVNVIRRCPPGPIFAALISSPDFDYLGSHYWRLSSE